MKLKEIFDESGFREWREKDPHLMELEASPFRWDWPCFEPIVETIREGIFSKTSQQRRGGIQILRGPRQVGKTTLVKSVVSELWKNRAPRTILIQGDWIEDFNGLDQCLRPYLESKIVPDLIVIDEVTFIREWQRALKGWYDEGLGRKTQFLLTGSNVFDLKHQSELLPGRRGKGGDFELLPMSFSEYVESCSSKLNAATMHDLFMTFLATGGFPHAVRELIENGKTEEAQETYLRWIRGDFLKADRSDSLLRELFLALLKTVMLPVGLDDLRRRSSMGSHNTVRDYLEYAEAGYVLFGISRIDLNKGVFFPRKNKKYYFRDPMIVIVARAWSGLTMEKEQFRALLCESIVAEELHRRDYRFGYYHDANSNEIDFASKDFLIEVKSGTQLELHSLLEKMNHGNKIQLYLGEAKREWKSKTGIIQVLPIWEFLLEA